MHTILSDPVSACPRVKEKLLRFGHLLKILSDAAGSAGSKHGLEQSSSTHNMPRLKDITNR